jgi:hypothetical protein
MVSTHCDNFGASAMLGSGICYIVTWAKGGGNSPADRVKK